MMVQAMMLQALGSKEMFRLMRLPPYDKATPEAGTPAPRRAKRTGKALEPAFG